MYTEDDLLPLSAVQHFLFCKRQCALIHIEQVWRENLYTAEGRIKHDRVHSEESESRGKIKREYGVPLRSLRLGLVGRVDIVEFHQLEETICKAKEQRNKHWLPFPVEYKRGKPKSNICDRAQICAQAICLEEMLNVAVPCGALYYGRTRHRHNVIFDENLRNATENAAIELHKLIKTGITPQPEYNKKCMMCSLHEICLPKYTGKKHSSVHHYLNQNMDFNEKTS